jgi:hypothetical protein
MAINLEEAQVKKQPIKTRMVIKADVAPFQEVPDLTIRVMRRVDGFWEFTTKGVLNKIKVYSDTYEKLPKENTVKVGDIGYIAGNITRAEVAPKTKVKILSTTSDVDNYIDFMDTAGEEYYGMNSSIFIPVKCAVKAGYSDIDKKEFEFNVSKLLAPIEKQIQPFDNGKSKVEVISLNDKETHVVFKFGEWFSVYNCDKRGFTVQPGELTGLYGSLEELLLTTNLKLAK